jgi:hypothetical protein
MVDAAEPTRQAALRALADPRLAYLLHTHDFVAPADLMRVRTDAFGEELERALATLRDASA